LLHAFDTKEMPSSSKKSKQRTKSGNQKKTEKRSFSSSSPQDKKGNGDTASSEGLTLGDLRKDPRSEDDILEALAQHYKPIREKQEKQEREEQQRRSVMNEPTGRRQKTKDTSQGATDQISSSEEEEKEFISNPRVWDPIAQKYQLDDERELNVPTDPNMDKNVWRILDDFQDSNAVFGRFQEIKHVHQQKAVFTNYRTGIRLVIEPKRAYIALSSKNVTFVAQSQLEISWRMTLWNKIAERHDNMKKGEFKKIAYSKDTGRVVSLFEPTDQEKTPFLAVDRVHGIELGNSMMTCTLFMYSLLQCSPFSETAMSFWTLLVRILRLWEHPSAEDFYKHHATNDDEEEVAETVPIPFIVIPSTIKNNSSSSSSSFNKTRGYVLCDESHPLPNIRMCTNFATNWLSHNEQKAFLS
jgi:hypothetical protein